MKHSLSAQLLVVLFVFCECYPDNRKRYDEELADSYYYPGDVLPTEEFPDDVMTKTTTTRSRTENVIPKPDVEYISPTASNRAVDNPEEKKIIKTPNAMSGVMDPEPNTIRDEIVKEADNEQYKKNENRIEDADKGDADDIDTSALMDIMNDIYNTLDNINKNEKQDLIKAQKKLYGNTLNPAYKLHRHSGDSNNPAYSEDVDVWFDSFEPRDKPNEREEPPEEKVVKCEISKGQNGTSESDNVTLDASCIKAEVLMNITEFENTTEVNATDLDENARMRRNAPTFQQLKDRRLIQARRMARRHYQIHNAAKPHNSRGVYTSAARKRPGKSRLGSEAEEENTNGVNRPAHSRQLSQSMVDFIVKRWKTHEKKLRETERKNAQKEVEQLQSEPLKRIKRSSDEDEDEDKDKDENVDDNEEDVTNGNPEHVTDEHQSQSSRRTQADDTRSPPQDYYYNLEEPYYNNRDTNKHNSEFNNDNRRYSDNDYDTQNAYRRSRRPTQSINRNADPDESGLVDPGQPPRRSHGLGSGSKDRSRNPDYEYVNREMLQTLPPRPRATLPRTHRPSLPEAGCRQKHEYTEGIRVYWTVNGLHMRGLTPAPNGANLAMEETLLAVPRENPTDENTDYAIEIRFYRPVRVKGVNINLETGITDVSLEILEEEKDDWEVILESPRKRKIYHLDHGYAELVTSHFITGIRIYPEKWHGIIRYKLPAITECLG